MKKTLFAVLVLAQVLSYAQETKELARLANATNAKVSFSTSTSNPNFIQFSKPLSFDAQGVKEKSSKFLTENYKAFNLASANDLVFTNEKTDNYGLKSVVYTQKYQGVPVFDGVLKLHFDKNENLTSVNGNVLSELNVNTQASVSQSEAEKIAIGIIADQDLSQSDAALVVTKTNLWIFPKNLAQGNLVEPFLAYEVEVTNKKDVREFIFIDAHTGKLVDQFTGIHPIDRKLYDISVDSGNLKWKEGNSFPGQLDNWQQNEVVTAEHTYNFFKNAFGIVSYNNADHTMVTVNKNPELDCPNANWNGLTTNFCDAIASDDIVAHEWSHAYTEYTSNLIYRYQSGALNESYSDVWGETIDLINNYLDEGENLSVRTTTDCNESLRWKIGEKATALGGAIRDMWFPNCNANPGRSLDSNYYCSSLDSGGVHINSGVPNHLYALLVDGGTYNGYTISKIGFVKAAHLWWKAQSTYLTRTSDFSNFADALEASAKDLIGINLQGLSTTTTPAGLSGESFTEADLENIKNGILAVELRSSVNSKCSFSPLLKPTPDLCSGATSMPLFKEDWENGIGGWTVSNVGTEPSIWTPRNWVIVGDLPKSRAGKAIFAVDLDTNDCNNASENGVLMLESPLITFPTFTSGKYEMAFNHYVSTEYYYDGGNIKYSLDDGAWTLVPSTAFTQNSYNYKIDNNSLNPMNGQKAFTGTDGGTNYGTWGQSVIDLSKLGVKSGSKIKFRFDMGTDRCTGIVGWYLDEIYVYNCSNLSVEDVLHKNNISVYPNPTSGLLSIQSKSKVNLKKILLYDGSGKLVNTFNLDNVDKASLDMSQLSNGIYILKINSESESNSVKVIKK